MCRYVRTRGLPSFPTRRSSDLDAFRGGGVGAKRNVIHAVKRVPHGMVEVVVGVQGGFHGDLTHHPQGIHLERGAARRREDRKSTRLNSSHRCISYAVFCLKKKK